MKNIFPTTNKKVITSYKLYYDEKCPLCLKTKSYIERWLKPINTNYISISSSNLNKQKKLKALNYMLLEDSIGNEYWGYNTYIKIFHLSSSKISLFFKFFSLLMQFPVVRLIGKIIYSKISKNRMRCGSSCKTK